MRASERGRFYYYCYYTVDLADLSSNCYPAFTGQAKQIICLQQHQPLGTGSHLKQQRRWRPFARLRRSIIRALLGLHTGRCHPAAVNAVVSAAAAHCVIALTYPSPCPLPALTAGAGAQHSTAGQPQHDKQQQQQSRPWQFLSFHQMSYNRLSRATGCGTEACTLWHQRLGIMN